MAQILIDHEGVDVRIRVNTSTIGGVTQTRVHLFFFGLAKVSFFLHNVSDISDLVFLLEVSLLNCLDSIFIFLLEFVKFIKAKSHVNLL